MARNPDRTVVVGAGSAGCVLAARLSEAGHDVLLVEAGPDYPDPAALPSDLANGHRNSIQHHDWGFSHRPNAQRRWAVLPRGRVVGGSSAVNTCIALRGRPEDYTEWADRGLTEWHWDACLPAFQAIERDLDATASSHRGTCGPLPIRRAASSVLSPWHAAFVEAARDAGFPWLDDIDSGPPEGVSATPMNKLDGRRISAAEAWLTPEVRARTNLTIQPNTRVRRILFEHRCAVGVDIVCRGQAARIPARRIILCAGALQSPAVLLRSGVGPTPTLAHLGVDRVADAPHVGSRLLDHPGAAIFFVPIRRGVVSTPILQTLLRHSSDDGPFAGDMQLQPGSGFMLPWFDLPLVSLMCHVGKPRGTGSLRWRSADLDARPQIQSRLLDNPTDRRRAVRTLQLAAELADHPAMRRLARPLVPLRRTTRSPDRFDRIIRRISDSGYHPCGTIPMGADGDPNAATDSRGRLRGVDGVWVADASLMPTIPVPNIHLTVLMMAERLAAWHAADAA